MVPTFEKFLYPFLLLLKNGEKTTSQMVDEVAEYLGLTDNTSYELNDLEYGKSYSIKVVAIDAAGNISLIPGSEEINEIEKEYKDEEKIKAILAENCSNRETFKFNKIPSDFRENDLLWLNMLEYDFWEGKDIGESYIKLSDFGKQLANLLIYP